MLGGKAVTTGSSPFAWGALAELPTPHRRLHQFGNNLVKFFEQLESPVSGFSFLTELECDCLITAFGPRGAAVECRVINPICTPGHTPGI